MILSKRPRAILIGGSSHSGKTTLAAALGARSGWAHISTDSLARHPGRPWAVETPEGLRTVKPHVVEHYRDLSVDELIADVLAHYKSMWSEIKALISAHVADISRGKLVLEGSALWPEEVATLEDTGVKALWLTASDDLFETRIKTESRFDVASPEERMLIEKFLARTLRYNSEMLQVAERLDLPVLCIDGLSTIEVYAQTLKLAE